MSGTVDSPACAALKAADIAWTTLNTNGAVRVFVDQNGERIEYSTANRQGLLSYIQTLQLQCPAYQALALGQRGCPRPLRFLF